MKVEHIWKIRDARGLDSWEKTFLFTAASHNGGMFCTWTKNCEDMGMKKDRYYKCVKSLTDKNLLNQTRRFDDSTVFVVNEDGLDDWLVAHSVSQNGDSVTQNAHSVSQKNHSVRPETKVNTKGNKKENSKENTNESAGASSLDLPLNKNDKEDQGTAPASPIGGNHEAPASPIVEDNTLGHSVTQNGEDYYDFNGRKVKRAGAGDPFEGAEAPVATEVKSKCSDCHRAQVFKDGYCWDCLPV